MRFTWIGSASTFLLLALPMFALAQAPGQQTPVGVPISAGPAAMQRPVGAGVPLGQPIQQVGYQQACPTCPPGYGGGHHGHMMRGTGNPGFANPGMGGAPGYPGFGVDQYPKQQAPTVYPYIGPHYPYPQIPLGWKNVTLEWDDGHWWLDFHRRRPSHHTH